MIGGAGFLLQQVHSGGVNGRRLDAPIAIEQVMVRIVIAWAANPNNRFQDSPLSFASNLVSR